MEAGDHLSHMRDRRHGPSCQHQPDSRRQPTAPTVGEHDHRCHRADAHRAGKLGDQAPAPRACLVSQLHQDKRSGDEDRHPEPTVRERERHDDQSPQHDQFSSRHTGCDPCALEPTTPTTVDQNDLEGRPHEKGHETSDGEADSRNARRDQESQEPGLQCQAPATVLARHRNCAQRRTLRRRSSTSAWGGHHAASQDHPSTPGAKAGRSTDDGEVSISVSSPRLNPERLRPTARSVDGRAERRRRQPPPSRPRRPPRA